MEIFVDQWISNTMDIPVNLYYNKWLCYSRGTARRTCHYRKACNWWTTL